MNRWAITVCGVLVLAVAGNLGARPAEDGPSAGRAPTKRSDESAQWRSCAAAAAVDFQVPLIVLTLLREMEGGRIGHEVVNTDGSYDIGPMQINSQHLPTFQRYGISRAMLRDMMCVNVYAAAFLLRDLMQRYPSVADVVAHYHSPTPSVQVIYLKRATGIVERRMRALRAAGVPRPERQSGKAKAGA